MEGVENRINRRCRMKQENTRPLKRADRDRPVARRRRPRRPAVSLAHGLFMAGAGMWPLIHLRSFEAVTGPKVDRWLVKSVGALLSAIGLSLMADGLRGDGSEAARVLGIGSAVALGGADIVYSARGVISPIYLLDAVAQAGAVAGWLSAGSDEE
jgi:hypothetical protein